MFKIQATKRLGQTTMEEQMKRFPILIAMLIGVLVTGTAHAAAIGVPGATLGSNKSMLGVEVNSLFDRDLEGGDLEGLQILAKGEVGLTDRVDLTLRFGFGQANGTFVNSFDTETGPAYGLGFKVTWAAVPDANLKIGTVAQTVQLRAKDDDNRITLTEYDLAIGAFLDMPGNRAPRAGEIGILPYGGLVWSGVDVQGVGAEEDTFGVFLGLAAKLGGNLQVGVELRIPEQTTLSIFAGLAF